MSSWTSLQPGLGLGLDAQQLLAVVPLVQRLGLVEALVALQAHELAVEVARDRLGQLGLADAGRPLDEDRLAEAGSRGRRRAPSSRGEVAGARPARRRRRRCRSVRWRARSGAGWGRVLGRLVGTRADRRASPRGDGPRGAPPAWPRSSVGASAACRGWSSAGAARRGRGRWRRARPRRARRSAVPRDVGAASSCRCGWACVSRHPVAAEYRPPRGRPRRSPTGRRSVLASRPPSGLSSSR